jgi:hypothetical protein
VKAGEVVVEAKALHVAPERNVAKLCFNKSELSAVDSFTDLALLKDSEAFVKPHVRPVLASYLVACPGVHDFMSGNIDLRAISYDDGWRSKSKERILHSTVGEARRENKKRVVAPDVILHIIFSHVKESTKVTEFMSIEVKIVNTRFSNY